MKTFKLFAVAFAFSCSSAFAMRYEDYLAKAEKASSAKQRINYYSGALSKKPGDSAAMAGRAKAYFEAGDAARAETDLRKALEISPESDTLNFELGGLLYRLDRYDEGISYLSRAVNGAPSVAKYYFYRGMAYAGLENYPRAVKNMTQAITLDPRAGVYPHKRGIFYYRMEDYKQAVKDYTLAIKLDPKDPIVRNNRAAAYLRLGEWDKAYADVSSALKFEKNFPSAYIHLSAYWWTGKKNKAKALENLDAAFKAGYRDFKSLYDEKDNGYFFRGLNKTREFEGIVAKYRK
ncbi:MAG: tetratricopeptide repeat protein [Elusimicrobiaceae bacterium]